MKDWLVGDWRGIVVLTLMAGLAMPLGAILARWERIQSRWLAEEFRHGVIAFGGGALLSAVALVLVPEGVAHLSPLPVTIWFLLGGFCFLGLDVLWTRRRTPMTQLAAMLSDFIPEAMALGAAIAAGSEAGVLLGLLMALQNLPEGFNAFRELRASKAFPERVLVRAFTLLALLGPLCGLLGFYLLADSPQVVAAIMLFAAGGILYAVFGDIAPQAHLKKHWLPPMGAVLGFLLGVVGDQFVG